MKKLIVLLAITTGALQAQTYSRAYTTTASTVLPTESVDLTTRWSADAANPLLQIRVKSDGQIIQVINPSAPAQNGAFGWKGTFAEGRHQLGTEWLYWDPTRLDWYGPGGADPTFFVDLTPPTGSVSLGDDVIQISAQDNIGIGRVELWTNSGSGWVMYQTPFTTSLPGTTTWNGTGQRPSVSGQVMAKVYDLAGRSYQTSPIEVAITQYYQMSRWISRSGGFWDTQQWVVGDFNGDGKSDLARVFNDSGLASIDVFISTGTQFVMRRWATRQGGFWDQQKWVAGDFNGDGLTDIAKVFNGGSGLACIDVHISSGGGFSMSRWETNAGGFWNAQKWIPGDFNGDGRCDLANVFNEGGQASVDVHQSSGAGFGMSRWASRQGDFWDQQQWGAGDFNGDGKADLVKVFNDGTGLAAIDVHTALGRTFDYQRWATGQRHFWDKQKWMFGRFNGDTACDVVVAFGENAEACVDNHLNTLPGFRGKRWAHHQGGYWDAQKWLVGDFNGDGMADLAKGFNEGGLTSIDVHVNNRFVP